MWTADTGAWPVAALAGWMRPPQCRSGPGTGRRHGEGRRRRGHAGSGAEAASEAAARGWLDRLGRVEWGDGASGEGAGDALTLNINRAGLTIESATFSEDPDLELRHRDLRLAFEAVLAVFRCHRTQA